MSFQASSIKHQEGGILSIFKGIKNVFEDTHFAPSDKSVIERFIGAIFFWIIFPLQAELEYIDDHAENSLIINSWPSPRTRKERANRVHSRRRKTKKSGHEKPPFPYLPLF